MSHPANVLIVDDEKSMRNTLTGILDEEGYRVFACPNGADAMRFLTTDMEQDSVDVVIADLKLPDISGLDIGLELKKVNPDGAFILMTGYATLETAIDAVNKGAFAYHVKPLDIEALKHSLRNAVEQHRLLVENRTLFERVKQSEIKYRTLVEQAADGIFMVEPSSGRLIEVNPRMAAITSYSNDELLSMTLPMLCPDLKRAEATELLERTLADREAAAHNLSFQKEHGEPVTVDINCSLVAHQGEEFIFGIVRDISERKAMEERLCAASRLASIGELAAGVAHQINNPLAVILGYAELSVAKGLPEPVDGQLRMVCSEAKRAANIVQNLLSFAKRQEPKKRYMDVTEVLGQALELSAYRFKVHNVRVTKQWSPDLPYTMVDEHQLMEVFLNVIINAQQAMTEAHGGGQLVVSAGKSGAGIRISITDDGPGISPEHLHKIFEPLFTTKGVGKGTGLGLSLSYGIIRQHGGEIWAESQLGSGATVHIELPVWGPAGGVEPAETTVKQTIVPPMHILVIDDEANMRGLLAEVLSMEHCTVDLARDGEEAWDKLRRGPYDCILLDLKMPGMSGQQLYKLIEESDRDLARKVVFITGDTISADTLAFIEATGNAAVSKPFSSIELRQQILRVLRGSPKFVQVAKRESRS